MKLRAAVDQVKRGGEGSGVPKVQIWRESKNHSEEYYKLGPDIPIVDNSSVCIRDRHSRGTNIFRCSLTESFQVSVQPGDIFGLELPPQDNDDFDIYLKTGGPPNHVFEGQHNCTINISKAAYQSNDLPQINLVVILGMKL